MRVNATTETSEIAINTRPSSRSMASRRTEFLTWLTIALTIAFIAVFYYSLKLVADTWYVGCVFGANGTKTCRFDPAWVPDPCIPTPPPAPGPPKLGGTNATLMHALFMALAFGVLTPLGSISFTLFRDLLGLSMTTAKAAHGMLKTGAVVLSVLGFLQQYYGHGSSCSAKDPNGIPEGPHMQSMHSWFGIIILGAYWIQGPSALAIFTNTKLLRPGTYWRMEARRYHLFVGYFSILGGLFTIYSGILAAAGKLAPDPHPAPPPPAFWWPMNLAGLICMALTACLALTLYENKVPVSKRIAPTMASPLFRSAQSAPLLAGAPPSTEDMVKISLAEVAKHCTESDCWLVIHGLVYDVTDFLRRHPGGAGMLLKYRGTVADEGFDQNHELSVLTNNLASEVELKGAVIETSSTPTSGLTGSALQPLQAAPLPPPTKGPAAAAAASSAVAAIDPASSNVFLKRQRQLIVIGDMSYLSHDVIRFRLILPPSTPVLGLPIGKHIKVYAPNATGKKAGEWNGRADPETVSPEIERKYTPTTSDDDRGFADLVIKVYKGGVIERFPDGGKMSQYLASLKVGSTLQISGPWGAHEYLGGGRFRSDNGVIACKRIGMLAGGTGLTPMLQIINAVLKEPEGASPSMSLLLANQTEGDILVRDMLEGLQKSHPKRFKLWYTLDRPPDGWKYSKGFITADMIQSHLPPKGEETLVLMCGPPPMVEFACKKNLDALGYAKERQICF